MLRSKLWPGVGIGLSRSCGNGGRPERRLSGRPRQTARDASRLRDRCVGLKWRLTYNESSCCIFSEGTSQKGANFRQFLPCARWKGAGDSHHRGGLRQIAPIFSDVQNVVPSRRMAATRVAATRSAPWRRSSEFCGPGMADIFLRLLFVYAKDAVSVTLSRPWGDARGVIE